MAILFILAGALMIAVGLSAWFGWYRVWSRGPFGNIVVPLVPAGAGVLVVGVGGLLGLGWVAFFGILLMLSGVLLYVISPTWLEPAWYRQHKATKRHG
jgi:asparagine N-glycosylation enzyme membrane subunit Stt3